MVWNDATDTLAIAIDNERHHLNHALQLVKRWGPSPSDAGDALCRWVAEQTDRRGPLPPTVQAFVTAGLRAVDWRALAEHYQQKIHEGALGDRGAA